MNSKNHAAAPLQPRRPLRTDFTEYTLRHAVTAKRRATTKQQLKAFFKEPFTMKSLTFLRTAPGAAVALVMLAATGAGAFTLTNWFNANVTVKQQESVFSVDLSDCRGNLPPGVNEGGDKRNVQFKILGNPHISPEQLQQRLLAQCEYDAVADFYRNNPNQGHVLSSGIVKAVHPGNQVTLEYFWGGTANEKTFTLSPDASIYDQGEQVSASSLAPGNPVVFTYTPQQVQEGENPFATTDTVTSIFKTKYDTRTGATKADSLYQTGNIMPLDWYNQIHK